MGHYVIIRKQIYNEKQKSLLQLIVAGQEKHILNDYLQTNPTVFDTVQSRKLTLNSFSLYQQNPTQPTTNRRTKTDFGEKDFNKEDALHVCIRLTECLWA